MSFSVYQLKPRFQQLLRPALQRLAHAGVTPNQLTVATALLCVGYGLLLACLPSQAWVWAGLAPLLLLRMALNALDGMLATLTQQQTPLGALLNELADQVSDAALLLPLALVPGVSSAAVVLLALLALLVEFSGVLAILIGSARRFDGPMGKSDRAVWLGLLGVLVASAAPPVWLHLLLAAGAVLMVWTVVNRVRQALRAQPAPPTP